MTDSIAQLGAGANDAAAGPATAADAWSAAVTVAATGLPGEPAEFIDLNMPTTIVGTMIIEELVTLTTDNATLLTDLSDSGAGGDDEVASHSPVVTAFVAVALSLIIILTIGGNILVVLSPIVSKRLRTVTYYFLVSLAIADLLLGITVLPWSAIYTISSEWPFSTVFCNIYISCDVMFCTASILHLLVISLERYFAITRPYAYQRKMNHRKATTIIIVVWVVSLGVSFLPLHLGWNTADGSVQNYNDPTQCILVWNKPYALFDGVLLFFLPLILMVFVYVRIVSIAYKQAKSIQKLMVKPAPSVRTTSPNGDMTDQEKQENTNNNHKNVVDEHKAVKIIAVVMGSFVVCWVPYFTMFTFGPLCNWNISDLLYNIVLWLGYINSLINPLVYALMNREFRRAFKTILSCARWNTKCIGSFGSRDHDSQIKFQGGGTPNYANSRYNGSTASYSTRETYATTGSTNSRNSASISSRKSGENLAKIMSKVVPDIAEVSEPSDEQQQQLQHSSPSHENHALLAGTGQQEQDSHPRDTVELQYIETQGQPSDLGGQPLSVTSPPPDSQAFLMDHYAAASFMNGIHAPLSQIDEVNELELEEEELEDHHHEDQQHSVSSSSVTASPAHESTQLLLQGHDDDDDDDKPLQGHGHVESHPAEKDPPSHEPSEEEQKRTPLQETTGLLQEHTDGGDEDRPLQEQVVKTDHDGDNNDMTTSEDQHLLNGHHSNEVDEVEDLKRPLSSTLSSSSRDKDIVEDLHIIT